MEKFLYGTSNVTVDDETGVKDAVVVEKEITANGTYIASNEPKVDGKTVDGYSEVEVDVQPNLQVGTGTVNGETYYPSTGYDGFSEFTVEIPPDTRVRHNIHLFGETNTESLDCYFTIINQDTTNYSTMELLYNAMVALNVGYSSATAVDASGTYISNNLTHTIIKIYVLKGTASGQTVYSPIAIDSDGTSWYWGNNSINVTDNVISGSANLLGQKNITQNGLYAADDEGYDGYRSVYVNVPADRTPRLQSKTAQASSSQQVITYDTGYDGLQQVTIGAIAGTYSISSNGEYDIAQYGKVSVNVETANIGAITGELTENRTYTALEYGLSGISSFTVRVPLNLQTTKTVSVSRNDIYTFTADSEYNGLQQIIVDVNVPRNVNVKPETFTANGIYQIPQDYDGYGVVTVNVPLENKKSARYTTNGVFTITPSSPNTAMKEVEVEVAVNNNTTTKTITSNGVYSANDDGVLGYSEVTVNVPQKLRYFVEDTLTEINASDIDGATTIKRLSFSERNALTKVEIPKTVTSVEKWAFEVCNYLTDVTINGGANRITIASYAFHGCPLTNIVIDCTNGNYSVILQDKCFSTADTRQCVVTILDDDRDPKAVFQGKPFPNAGDSSKLIIKVSSMWLDNYRISYPDYANNFDDNE